LLKFAMCLHFFLNINRKTALQRKWKEIHRHVFVNSHCVGKFCLVSYWLMPHLPDLSSHPASGNIFSAGVCFIWPFPSSLYELARCYPYTICGISQWLSPTPIALPSGSPIAHRCYTPCQFAAIPLVSSLLYPVSVRCYTLCQFAAIPRVSSLLYPVTCQFADIPRVRSLPYPVTVHGYTLCQFAAIPRVSSLLFPVVSVRCYTPWCEDLPPSRSLAERGQSHRQATCPLPPCGWADGRSTVSELLHGTPPLASPSLGVDGTPGQAGIWLSNI
jgi:hypothetical protein